MESNNNLDQMEQIDHRIIHVLFPVQSVFPKFLSVFDKVSLLSTPNRLVHFAFPKISYKYHIGYIIWDEPQVLLEAFLGDWNMQQ